MIPAMLSSFGFNMRYSDFIESASSILDSVCAENRPSFPRFITQEHLECFPPDRSEAMLDGSFTKSDATRYAAAVFYRLLTGTSPYVRLEKTSDFWNTERSFDQDCFSHQIFTLLPDLEDNIKRYLTTHKDTQGHEASLFYKQLNLDTSFGKIESFIGKGATSSVYSVTPGCGSKAALKLSTEKHRERLKREYSALSANRHRHIIRAFSYAETGGIGGMTMELLTGERTSHEHADALSEGLSHLHGNGILHGDVKHANTGLTTDGRAVVFDLSHIKNVSELPPDAATLELEKLRSIFSPQPETQISNAKPQTGNLQNQIREL